MKIEFAGGVSRRQWNCAAIIFLFVGCNSSSNQPSPDGRLQVIAGIPPLAGVVERIGGERVAVESLVAPGQDPHTFEPTPRQAAAIALAAVVFQIGMPFETAVIEKIRAGNPRLRVVDAAEGLEKRPLENPCAEHGHEHEHEADGAAFDPHVWLSPPLLKSVAARVAEGLAAADPAGAEQYQKNLLALRNELDALHQRITDKLSSFRGRTFIVYHPGFGYFADAYGLKELAVQSGGHAPTPKQLRGLIELARRQNIKTVFVQPEFDPRGATLVAEALGGEAVRLDGLSRDVLGGMEEIAEKIERAFGDKLRDER